MKMSRGCALDVGNSEYPTRVLHSPNMRSIRGSIHLYRNCILGCLPLKKLSPSVARQHAPQRGPPVWPPSVAAQHGCLPLRKLSQVLPPPALPPKRCPPAWPPNVAAQRGCPGWLPSMAVCLSKSCRPELSPSVAPCVAPGVAPQRGPQHGCPAWLPSMACLPLKK